MYEQNKLNEAFEVLLKEIESVIETLNKEAKESLDLGDYEKTKSLIEDAIKIADFREKVKNLQKEWQTLFTSKTSGIESMKHKKFKKLKHGLKTPQYAYRLPILESLIELGGRAETKVVLEKVKQKMENILNDYDMQPLPSGGIRWENTAQWARNTMVKEGLLSADSPRGIWEITEKGREYLKRLKEESDRDNNQL